MQCFSDVLMFILISIGRMPKQNMRNAHRRRSNATLNDNAPPAPQKGTWRRVILLR